MSCTVIGVYINKRDAFGLFFKQEVSYYKFERLLQKLKTIC